MNNPATTREWIGRRRLRASVDRTLGVKVPKAVFDEAEAYARRKMAFQNEVLGLDRGDEYLELLIPDVIREMVLAARYDGRRATSSSAPSAVPTLHGPKLESRASVRSADNP